MKKVLASFAFTLGAGLAAAAPLALTTGNDYAPFVHSQLPGGGLATEVVRAAFEAQGSQVELAGSTMCLPTGWAAPPALAELVSAGKVKRAEARDASFCLRMVQNGRADYFVTDAYQGRESMKGAGLSVDALQMSSAVLASRPLYLLAPRGQAGSNEVIESFNTGLRSIKKSGKYDQIVQRFIK